MSKTKKMNNKEQKSITEPTEEELKLLNTHLLEKSIKREPNLYIVLKYHEGYSAATLLYADDDESIYRYIFYENYRDFIINSDIFKGLRENLSIDRIMVIKDPRSFSIAEIKNIIDNSVYVGTEASAYRIKEQKLDNLPYIQETRKNENQKVLNRKAFMSQKSRTPDDLDGINGDFSDEPIVVNKKERGPVKKTRAKN